jgi:pimeloyl-ACP methyl ester carboxylesterase
MIALRTLASSQPSGYDLVLVHAFPLASTMYDDVAKELQKDRPDLTVHLVDLPGFGKAPYREHWTIAEAMRSLHDMLHTQGVVSPVIGGVSMGGYAVLAYYRLYPEEVEGLILSNTKAAADDEEAKKNREVFAQDVEVRGHEAVYERMLDKLISPQYSEMREQLKGSISVSSSRAIAAALRAMALRENSLDLLESIECPALVISGSNDTIMTPEDAAKLQTIRNSHGVVIDGTAHLSLLEAPEKWTEQVAKFLSTLVGSPI